MSLIPQLLAQRTDTVSTEGAMLRQSPGHTALVLDSPHSGTNYPADFGYSCELGELRRAEDTHVEKLYNFAPGMGVAWIEALFPRSYLDVNRNTTEIDVTLIDERWPGSVEANELAVAKVRLGKGLIWRCTDDGTPIYARRLTVAEVRSRIQRCWKPYHTEIARAVSAAHERHGFCIHVNCHSMPAIASSHATAFPGLVHADFVVGDRDGATADPRLSELICGHLTSLGYSVSYNHPYKGVELVRRHGNPARNRHSIQVEINRRLYMDEQTLELHGGFNQLRENLRSLVKLLLETDPRDPASFRIP